MQLTGSGPSDFILKSKNQAFIEVKNEKEDDHTDKNEKINIKTDRITIKIY